MTVFLVLAGLILIVVIGLLLTPIIKLPSQQPRYLTVLATGAGLPIFVVGLYLAIGNWQLSDSIPVSRSVDTAPGPEAGPESVEAMVSTLALRLQTQGGSAQEWQMLGRSYMVMGWYGEAAAAFAAARAQDTSNDPELSGQYAEALILSEQGALAGEAGQIIEQVLAVQPNEPRALWYGGIAALERGDNDLAISRWQSLLNQNPPDELREVLQARITQAGGGSTATSAPANTEATPQGSNATIKVSVSAAAEMLANVSPQTPLFVLARTQQPGPPLAVKRMRVADLPFEVTLSAQDAMIPGREIDFRDATEIVARVALSGTPQASSGDLFGQVMLSSDQPGATINIVIDRRVQ